MPTSYDNVCANTSSLTYNPLGTKTTFLNASRELPTAAGTVPLWNPTNVTLSYTETTGGTSKTATLTNLGDKVTAVVSGRYAEPASGTYWNPITRSAELTTSQLDTLYSNLKTAQLIRTIQDTTLPGSRTNTVLSISYDLLYSLKYEVCYYLKVYQILLGDLANVNNPGTPSLSTTQLTEQNRRIANKLSEIKLRISDLIQLSQSIGSKQNDEMKKLQTGANTNLESITADVTSLNNSLADLTKNDKLSTLRSRQLEFTEEKNAYANQLLGLYGFANLIALGLLFYIYKS